MKYAVCITESEDGKLDLAYLGRSRMEARAKAKEIVAAAPLGIARVTAFGNIANLVDKRVGKISSDVVTDPVEAPEPAKAEPAKPKK